MELTHRFTVPTGIDEAWAHFNDIASVAECFPGAQVTSVDGETFSGSVKVKLGPIALVYNGTGTFIEKDEAAHRFRVEAKGKDKRGNGTAGAHVTLTMTSSGSGSGSGSGESTDVEVLTDLAITGKPAQFGRGVMQDVSDKLLGQFMDCLEQRLGQSGAAASEPGATPGDESGEQAGGTVGDQVAGAAGSADAARLAGQAAAAATDTEPAAPGADVSPGVADEVTPVTSVPGPRGPSASEHRPSAGGGGGQRPSADHVDLGATVLPVLARTYWKQGLGALAVLWLLWRWKRRGGD